MKFGLVAFALLLFACASNAASLPRIIASTDNPVPQCVAPASLMDFIAARNARQQPPRTIDPRFAKVAELYQRFGQCVARPPEKCIAVRWDYAFFQMLIETNYLTFLRPNGVPAAVSARDNNFAGIGATVSGRPGEHFKDVSTGVLAHLQHVLMYSTTHIPEPVAERTGKVQGDVQDIMRRLGHPITFADLSREWTGTNKNSYGTELQKMAEKYAAGFCRDQTRSEQASLR